MKYIELHAASAFSFLQGASVPEELVEGCTQYGIEAMALADLNGVYGAPRFHMAAQKAKLKAHIGAEIISTFRFPISDCKNLRAETEGEAAAVQSKIKHQKSKVEN